MPPLPARPDGRPSPRELLGVLEAHVGTAGAAALCAELLAADDPQEHPATLLFLGGPAGRSVLDGSGWQPFRARDLLEDQSADVRRAAARALDRLEARLDLTPGPTGSLPRP